jgi:hypothetical protein
MSFPKPSHGETNTDAPKPASTNADGGRLQTAFVDEPKRNLGIIRTSCHGDAGRRAGDPAVFDNISDLYVMERKVAAAGPVRDYHEGVHAARGQETHVAAGDEHRVGVDLQAAKAPLLPLVDAIRSGSLTLEQMSALRASVEDLQGLAAECKDVGNWAELRYVHGLIDSIEGVSGRMGFKGNERQLAARTEPNGTIAGPADHPLLMLASAVSGLPKLDLVGRPDRPDIAEMLANRMSGPAEATRIRVDLTDQWADASKKAPATRA